MRLMVVAALLLATLGGGCALTSHATQPSSLGTPSRAAALFAVIDTPGPIELETVNSSDWAVDKSGLINLHHARAKAAGLKDGLEPIQIYFHALRHPTRGLYIVDTGVERALRDQPKRAAIRGAVASYMKLRRLDVHMPLGDWLAKQATPLVGVFMTHLHLDHVSGMPDVPHGTPIYGGPGESKARAARNLFVAPNIDRTLAEQAPVSEWAFQPDPDGRFAGVIDVFGDGSLWAIYTPGHTRGATAYLVRTPGGPVLLTGDTCHTAWGWEHDVEPGGFTDDHSANVESLRQLRQLVREHPAIAVRLGHQPISLTR
jgi:glyoxylase-like metal-dependent hydrolase (beta-lactamase superfamily II)